MRGVLLTVVHPARDPADAAAVVERPAFAAAADPPLAGERVVGPRQPRFGPGPLDIRPAATSGREPPLGGAVVTAHLVSRVPVKPLARIGVTPADFPFRPRIGYHRDREPIWGHYFAQNP